MIIERDLAVRIVGFMKYLDSCVNIEPAGPSRNRDFHMQTECIGIRQELQASEGFYEAGHILQP